MPHVSAGAGGGGGGGGGGLVQCQVCKSKSLSVPRFIGESGTVFSSSGETITESLITG